MVRILTLTDSTTCQRPKAIGSFLRTRSTGFSRKFWQFASPFFGVLKMTSQKKGKVGTREHIFHEVSKNVVVFDAALWEIADFTNLFSKSQK